MNSNPKTTNLFDSYREKYGTGPSKNISEAQILEFLKRVVFKTIVILEHVNFMFEGKITARDAYLNEIKAEIQLKVTTSINQRNPFVTEDSKKD